MVGMFLLIICSFDLISICWKDYPKGDLIRREKRTIYFLRCVHCPWPVKVIPFEPAWTSNKAYICFAYVEEWHLLLKLCRFESCFYPSKFHLKKKFAEATSPDDTFVTTELWKLAHETLDNSPMKKIVTIVTIVTSGKWYIRSKLDNLIWMCWMWFPIVTEELFKEASTVLTWMIF